MRLSQLINYVAITPGENTDDDFRGFYLIKDTTLPIHRYGKPERPSLKAPKNYPGQKATKTWNELRRRQQRAARTKEVFNRIQTLLNANIAISHREYLKNKFSDELSVLRPHPNKLFQKYILSGETEETTQLLLNNYDLLPDVKISEDQYTFLQDVIEGTVNTSIIEKGFEV